MSNMQYRYVQFCQRDGSVGYAVFAFNKPAIEANKDPIEYECSFGVSFCSPKDFFIKTIGRKKASTRLTGERTKKPVVGKALVSVVKNGFANKDFFMLLEDVISNNKDEFPRWALKAWERGDVVLTTSPLDRSNEEDETTLKTRSLSTFRSLSSK